MEYARKKKALYKVWLVRFLLVIGSVAGTLLVLEGGVRLFLPPPYQFEGGEAPLFYDQAVDMFTCDSTLGWVGTSGFEGLVELSSHKAYIALNSEGMHDTEHTLPKPPDTFRILMLGDSFVHAIQVEEPNTTHQVLEDILNTETVDTSLNVEVISGGVTGWGTGQQLVYYRQKGRYFQPDLVLLMFFMGNDLKDNLPGHALTIGGGNCYAPHFAICDGMLDPEALNFAPGVTHFKNNCSTVKRFLNNAFGALYQKSRLYQQLEPLIVSHYPRQIFGKGYPNSFWGLYVPNNDEPELEQSWQVTKGLIQQFKQEVEADGGQFAVAFFTWSILMDVLLMPTDQQQALLVENPHFAAIEPDLPHRQLSEFLQSQDILYIDLTEPLMNQQVQQASPLHFTGDNHWTVEGSRFVAETLSHWLKQNEALPEADVE